MGYAGGQGTCKTAYGLELRPLIFSDHFVRLLPFPPSFPASSWTIPERGISLASELGATLLGCFDGRRALRVPGVPHHGIGSSPHRPGSLASTGLLLFSQGFRRPSFGTSMSLTSANSFEGMTRKGLNMQELWQRPFGAACAGSLLCRVPSVRAKGFGRICWTHPQQPTVCPSICTASCWRTVRTDLCDILKQMLPADLDFWKREMATSLGQSKKGLGFRCSTRCIACDFFDSGPE